MKKIALLIIVNLISWPVFALNVAVTIKPLHSLVQSILGEQTHAVLIIDSSASPHDVQLKPSDIRALQRANLVFMIDRRFEGFMHRIIDSGSGKLTVIEMSEFEQLKRLPPRDHRHGAHTGQIYAQIDPHLWLNPENAKSMATIIAHQLAEIDNSNAKLYNTNLEHTLGKLDELDNALNIQLSGFSDLAFMTQHDAYQYFEERYNLKFAGAIALDSGIPASVKLALNIQKSIRAHDVRCIFREPQYSDRLVKTIAENAGIKNGILDPVGVGLTPGPELYFDLMRNLGSNFTKCFSD